MTNKGAKKPANQATTNQRNDTPINYDTKEHNN